MQMIRVVSRYGDCMDFLVEGDRRGFLGYILRRNEVVERLTYSAQKNTTNDGRWFDIVRCILSELGGVLVEHYKGRTTFLPKVPDVLVDPTWSSNIEQPTQFVKTCEVSN